MPQMHARKNDLAHLKESLGIKHADAVALLDHPDADERARLCEYLEEYVDINTYREAVDYLKQEQSDPRNQVMCQRCGWTYGMVCPECEEGCGCSYGCTGWRHGEYTEYDPDHEPEDECDCGYVGDLDSGEHVYNCVC